MSLWTCVACSTRYSVGASSCPHCGSSDYAEAHAPTTRLPVLVTTSCSSCPAGPWQLRLSLVKSGLLEIPNLFCASCGAQVIVPWPPEEEPMSPKITVHGGATNDRDADVSPAADAIQPLVGAEADQGHPTSDEPTLQDEDAPEVDDVQDETEDVEDEETSDYDGMTLAELRTAASDRDLPSYGTKAQVIERLREADASA